jgi:hypothetical protein
LTVELTPEKAWQKKFITRLCQTGNISAACRKAKITRQGAYQSRDADELFKAAWDEALIISTEALELEARRRAAIGVQEPVFHQGMQVALVRKYSDTLLIFLLKAHKPEMYRERVEASHSGEVTIRVLYGNEGTGSTPTATTPKTD